MHSAEIQTRPVAGHDCQSDENLGSDFEEGGNIRMPFELLNQQRHGRRMPETASGLPTQVAMFAIYLEPQMPNVIHRQIGTEIKR